MDFEGLTWVGDIYQKFEAMCLEVEEVMYQDTAKYVENQVQMVGASMRKLYSDVMQELLPPSSTDPLKVAAAELSVNPYAHIGIHKKQKTGIKGDYKEVNTQSHWDSKDITAPDANHGSSSSELPFVNHHHLSSTEGSVIRACSEPLSWQSKYGKVQKSSIVDREEKSEDNSSPLKTSRSTIDEPEDCSDVSSCYETKGTHEVTFGQMAIVSPSDSVEVSEWEFTQNEGNFCSQLLDVDVSLSDASTNTLKSYMFPSVQTETGNTPSSGGLSSEFVGRSSDENENNDKIEPELEIMENVDQLEKSKLEQTCVLVDLDKHWFNSHGKGRDKSYKKEIQEAFSSKKMTARKREYKRLAAQHGDAETQSKQGSVESMMSSLPINPNMKLSPTQDSCESEWELL